MMLLTQKLLPERGEPAILRTVRLAGGEHADVVAEHLDFDGLRLSSTCVRDKRTP